MNQETEERAAFEAAYQGFDLTRMSDLHLVAYYLAPATQTAWEGFQTGVEWATKASTEPSTDIRNTTVSAEPRADALRVLLSDAVEEIESWAGYASEYFQVKHDLAGTLERFRAALAEQPTRGAEEGVKSEKSLMNQGPSVGADEGSEP